MASHTLDGPTISNITDKEKQITGEARPVKGGPTAQAQKHTGETITDATVSAIAGGENTITHEDAPRADGPTAFVESLVSGQEAPATTVQHTGKLDDSTISAIAEAEKRITGQDGLVEGGPTAQAQKHAGEPINRASLHDITEGEKTITHEVSAVKGGPTATAQSELNWFYFDHLFIAVTAELLDLPTSTTQPSHHPGQCLRRIAHPLTDPIRSEPINASTLPYQGWPGGCRRRSACPAPRCGCRLNGNSRSTHGDVGDLVAGELPENRARLQSQMLGPPEQLAWWQPFGALVQVSPFSHSCEIAASA
ncbi:hypothetical protein DL768_002747 [Monosporascus sp. mg162]|nr:hypothetical protein DL768_002747 [Monosporascus sp. mg162]